MRAPDSREVHLRIVQLEASDENFARARAWLSPDEIARAERLRFDDHRRRFILGRAALRALLADYLGAQPADVAFVYGPHGKPDLADASCLLRFNTSNSSNLAAYAFTTGCDIGVDVEQHRPLHDMEAIAHRFFSPEETADLMALPEASRITAFFNCWSRKEAYIKAKGGGLSIPLDSFQVTLQPGAAPRMVSLDGSAGAARAWTMHAFTPRPQCAGAIAYPDQPRSVQGGQMVSFDSLLLWLGR